MADNRSKDLKALGWERKTAWDKLKISEKKVLERYCQEYLDCVSRAKTEREFFDFTVSLLKKNKFKQLDRSNKLVPGDCIFRDNRGKTLFIARIGKRPLREGVHIVGGHIDSPRLDTKPVPLYEDSDMVLLDTHYYGGIRKYQWVTMPLALHGIVVKEDGSKVKINIGEKFGDPVFVITDLLPHLSKDQNSKRLDEGITGEGLNVLFGSIPAGKKTDKKRVKSNILRILNQQYGIKEEDLISAELELVPAGPARELGLDRSMLLAYGHDDRVCSYGALRALLDCEKIPEYTSVVLLCDKEEIGSYGATGMQSVFFENTVAELLSRQEKNFANLHLRRCLENSRMISADVDALHDPNYPDVSSPNNMAHMNAGVVLTKYTGARGKSGASEAGAEFIAELRKIFNKAGVFWQTGELGKVDQGGGGTIALLLARYCMEVVDCGVGLLNMHAPWEVAGKLDVYMAYKAYSAFLKAVR